MTSTIATRSKIRNHTYYSERTLSSSKVLLVNPAVHDYRLSWAKWHQPTGLLQIASHLRANGADLELIDCLASSGTRMKRKLVSSEIIEGYDFKKWRFGLSEQLVKNRLKVLTDRGWLPDLILVTSLNTIWWEGVRDSIGLLKSQYPDTEVILGGNYPTLCSDHAVNNSGADTLIIGTLSDTSNHFPDISLYANPPRSAGLQLLRQSDNAGKICTRSTDAVADFIANAFDKGTREIVIVDEIISSGHREYVEELLYRLSERGSRSRLVFPGNLSPDFVTPSLAKLMQKNVREVHFHCDMNLDGASPEYTTTLDDYIRAIDLLVRYGGFKPRSGDVSAILQVGMPNEDLGTVSERLIMLAHIVGSVILLPFQYTPGLHHGELFGSGSDEAFALSPEQFNGKTYPIARLNGTPIEEYMELTRLATLLNSKYRSRTFDFLGNSLTAKLFRNSIRSRSWDPVTRSADGHVDNDGRASASSREDNGN